MDLGTGHGMSSLASGRRERRDERAAQRQQAARQLTVRTRRNSSFRSVMLCISLWAGALFITAPSSTVVAVGGSVTGPAALKVGLQSADRLDPPTPRGPIMSAEVLAILDLVNAQRALNGIGPLAYHEQLTQAAQAHAANQFTRDCLTQLSHTGTDGSDPGDRIARTGLSVRNWAENIACGQRTPEQVMTAWMNSSGHRRNILNSSLTHIGISVSRDSDGRLYWVQVFGTPR